MWGHGPARTVQNTESDPVEDSHPEQSSESQDWESLETHANVNRIPRMLPHQGV